jgi:hypothetical protein
MNNHLYAVDGRYFYAGILVNDGVIVNAAPVLRWSVGQSFTAFMDYARRKNWGVVDAEIHPDG